IAAEKCTIMARSVDYLGHTFGPDGMTPDVKKVETILRWPVPTLVSELRSFLGLANYYRGFLPHFSNQARALYDLVTESTKIKSSTLLPWTEECEAAFVDIKEGLARLPLLNYPDFLRPFQLVTDASDAAIGGVLEQDGAPLSFFSQALTSTQRRWPVYEHYVAQCSRCLTIKARQQPPAALVPFPVGAPWHTIAVDFLFVGPSDQGPTKLLVIVDHFTRWADAYVVKGEGATDALAPLLQLCSQFGPPMRLLSDQGPAFESEIFHDVMKILGVTKVRSTPHHPSSNGHVERFNSTILNLLRMATQTIGDWQGHLRGVLWQYNSTPHSATGFTPFYLMFGREAPQMLLPSLYQYSSLMHDPESYAAYLARARAKIDDVMDEWATANGASYRLAALRQPSHRRHYVGQRVRLKIFHGNNAPARKLLPKWQADWCIFKFVAGSNNKTVVVRHFPDPREKVISTDYILADPIQPEMIPVQLNIVRMEPPVDEAPRVPLYPFKEIPRTGPVLQEDHLDHFADSDEVSSYVAEMGSPSHDRLYQPQPSAYWVAQDDTDVLQPLPQVGEVRSPQDGDMLIEDASGP
ncbi:retrovirus polyprotein, putative, partial [Perkinsus marinus ATCC 50983]